MENISKKFFDVEVLKNVTVGFREKEIHAIVGENGAGKSTLLKILVGIHQPEEGGKLFLRDKLVCIRSPREAHQLGIKMVYQELDIFSKLSVAENIFIDGLPRKALGLIDYRKLYLEANKELQTLGVDIDSTLLAKDLSIAQCQLVSIIGSLQFSPSVLLLDEPTSTLSLHEVERLFKVLRKLKEERGLAIVYVSHRMNEIFGIADKVTVLRDGACIGTAKIDDINPQKLVEMEVGHKIEPVSYSRGSVSDEVVLEVKNLSDGKKFRNVSFQLRKGEMLGITGLVGAGKTEIVESICGLRKIKSGYIYVKGHKAMIHTLNDAMKLKIGFIPDDRKLKGLFLGWGIKENLSIVCLEMIVNHGFLSRRMEREFSNYHTKLINIVYLDLEGFVDNLSGGNQQKLLITRWLSWEPEILIFDEPTRGVDVETKAAILSQLDEFTRQGNSIIISSSDVEDIREVDRVIIVRDGEVIEELSKKEASLHRIIELSINDNKKVE